jgi:hypothetical protein
LVTLPKNNCWFSRYKTFGTLFHTQGIFESYRKIIRPKREKHTISKTILDFLLSTLTVYAVDPKASGKLYLNGG